MLNITLTDLIRMGAELETVSVTVHLNESSYKPGFRQMVSITYAMKEDNLVKDWLAKNKVPEVYYTSEGRRVNAFDEVHEFAKATFEIQRLTVK